MPGHLLKLLVLVHIRRRLLGYVVPQSLHARVRLVEILRRTHAPHLRGVQPPVDMPGWRLLRPWHGAGTLPDAHDHADTFDAGAAICL